MSYEPPSGSSVVLDFNGAYVPPIGSNVVLNFGPESGAATSVRWHSEGPFQLLGNISQLQISVEAFRTLSIALESPFNPAIYIRARNPDMAPTDARWTSLSPMGSPRISLKVELARDIYESNLFTYRVQIPIREYLEWSNSSFSNRKGKDYLLNFFTRPRRMIDYKLFIPSSGRTEVYGSIINSKGKVWKLPDWREMEHVSLPMSTTQFSTEANYPLEGELIFWNSASDWEILEYSRVGSILYLVEPTSRDWIDSRVMPIIVGRVEGEPTIHTIETVTIFNFSFELLENPIAVPDYLEEIFKTYNGVEVFEQCPVYTGTTGIESTSNQLEEKFDPGTGEKHIVPIWDCPRHSTRFLTIQENREELNTILRWLYRRYGRYEPFYMPSWNRDFILYDTGAVADILTVENTGYSSCIKHLAVRTQDGAWIYRGILSAEYIGNILHIQLDSALNLFPSEIERISHVRKYSLDTNRVEIVHRGDLQSDCILKIKEVDRDVV